MKKKNIDGKLRKIVKTLLVFPSKKKHTSTIDAAPGGFSHETSVCNRAQC